MTKNYKFYMCKVDRDGVQTDKRDLERDFKGCRYRYCKGLETKGAPKNIYTEDYPEKDGLRVFHPSDILDEIVRYKETEIELGLIFLGEERRASYESFCNYIRSSRIRYWDNARNRKVELILKSETAPTEDTLKGGVLYIDVAFKFTNVWGYAKECLDEDGTTIN